MSWVKLDDQFFSHPKAREAGKDACLLYLAGLTYCARHLTDGTIPKSSVAIIAAEAWARPSSARKLVEAGLWHDHGTHYTAHDYLDHNPSREQVEKTRREARERRSRDGKRSRDVRATRVNPDPTPPDVPTEHQDSRGEPYESDFAELWKHYPRKVDRGAALAAYQARRREGTTHGALLAAVTAYAESCDGQDRQYVKHGATFLAKRGAWPEWVSGPPIDAMTNEDLGAKPLLDLEPPGGPTFADVEQHGRDVGPYACPLELGCDNGWHDGPNGAIRCSCLTKATA